MMDVKGYKRKGVLVFNSHIPIIWLLVVGGGYCLFPGIIDMPEKCNFTNLLCNESRLLKEDKIIILNIENELRNRVAGGSFKYLNLQHDPVTDMNKLYWNETIARKATMIVSSCPSTSESFIDSQTTIESGDNAIDQIIIENSIDPTTYQPDYEIPNCEVSSITYQEQLTQCAPQKIKERVIRFLSEYGLSAEGRHYDIRDFWIVNRYGEPKLTFRRHESSQLGCSFMIRVSKTHYHAYLTCVYCPFNASLPTIGHPGENCPTRYPNLDAKYENLCSDSKSEYGNIEDDQSIIECKNETSSKTDYDGLLTETTESDADKQSVTKADERKKDDTTKSSISDIYEGGKSKRPTTFLPGQNQSVVTSSCKTTIVERYKTLAEVSPAISSQIIITSSQIPERSETYFTSQTPSEVGKTTETTSKMKIIDKPEFISTTSTEEIPVEMPSKGIDLTTEITSRKEASTPQETTTTVYGSTASTSTFGIADLKTLSSTIVLKEITAEKQSEDAVSMKSRLDKSTLPITTTESPLTGSSKFPVITSSPSTTINSFFNTSLFPVISTLALLTLTEPSTFTNVLQTTSELPSITGSNLPPTAESLTSLTMSTPSSAAELKDFVTTCKTTFIPSNKTYTTQTYIHVFSTPSVSDKTQPELNTVIFNSTSVASLLPTNIIDLSTTTTVKPESTTIISPSDKSMPVEIETSTREMKTTKKVTLIAKKFMTRKKPIGTSTKIYSTPTATPTAVEVTTQLTDENISSELVKLNLSTITGMKTTFTASTPTTTYIEHEINSTFTPISIISSESTKYGAKLTNFINISIDKTTEVGVLPTSPVISLVTSDTSKDHSILISTQTTTYKTTTVGINALSTCKTTIPVSKSISVSSTPLSSLSSQLSNQTIFTSTTTYKTTIPTEKSTFTSFKESTPISSQSVTTDITLASIGPAIQTSSVQITEPTAMTTLPNTRFSFFSPKLNITSNISPEITTDLSKMTQVTKNLISSITYFTSTATSVEKTDTAQTPSSPQLDSIPSSKFYTSSEYILPEITSAQTTISRIIMPHKESITSTSITHRTTLEDELQTSKEMTSKRIQSLAPISIISMSTEQTPVVQTITTGKTLPQSLLSKSTSFEEIFHSPSVSNPITTTCRTTISYTDAISSTSTYKTIPTTESIATKTVYKITGSSFDSSTALSTATTSNLTTINEITIPNLKLITEMTPTFTENFINYMKSSTNQISIASSYNNDTTSLITTTHGPIINIAKNATEKWPQRTNIPVITTGKTILNKSIIPTISSSTCKTTIHHRQLISITTDSSATASSLLSEATDMIPESTTSITQSSDFQNPLSLFPVSTSTTIPQTPISVSDLSITPTSRICEITTLLESTSSNLPSTTIRRSTSPTIKSSIPIKTTYQTTVVRDITSDTRTSKIISITEAPISTGSDNQPLTSLSYTTPSTITTTVCQSTRATSTTSLPIVKSSETYPIIPSTSKIIPTKLVLSSTTIIPSTIPSICTPLINTLQSTTTYRTTLTSAYPFTSTCKTTFIDRLNISTIKIQETTLPIKKIDMISTIIPLSSTSLKTNYTLLPPIAITNLSTTTYKTSNTFITESSTGENIYTNATASISTIASAKSTPTPKYSSTIGSTMFVSTEKPDTESVTSSKELLEILPTITSLSESSLFETTTYFSLDSIETSSCKTTICLRKLPISSNEPMTKLITQQPNIPSYNTSVTSVTSSSIKTDSNSTPIPYFTLHSIKPDMSIPISSIPTILEFKKTDQTTDYSAKSFPTSTVSKSSTETIIFATSPPPPITPFPLHYETNVSLIPQEDSTILEQLTTKNLPNSLDQTINQFIISSSTSKATILGSDTTSTYERISTAHSFIKENEVGTALSNIIPIFSTETLPSKSNSTLITRELTETPDKSTEFLALEPSTTYKSTNLTIVSNLSRILTYTTKIPSTIQSLISTPTFFELMPSPPSTIFIEQLNMTTTCKTSLLSTATTCRTTIPTTLFSTSTCKTTIPTKFLIAEPTIITLLPISNQTPSSFIAPESAIISQILPLSPSTVLESSSTSSVSNLEEFKTYTRKTTEYLQSASLEITTPNIHIDSEREYVEITTQFINTSVNFTTIFESKTSNIEKISTSTSTSLTEGLSSKLSTFIFSLLPSGWRSSQNQPTSTYSTRIKPTDITSIFLSSLAPDKGITSTPRSPSNNLAIIPKQTVTPDVTKYMFISNSTTPANNFVTDMYGYVISSNIPPIELSNTGVKTFTVPSSSHSTFRSHRESTLSSTNFFSETTPSSAFSTIYSIPSYRNTAVNCSRATCISTTTFDFTSYRPNSTSEESGKDIFDSRNTTVPVSKSRPCLCINWYLICLIFTIAFIFAWCLLCWQKMLL